MLERERERQKERERERERERARKGGREKEENDLLGTFDKEENNETYKKVRPRKQELRNKLKNEIVTVSQSKTGKLLLLYSLLLKTFS